MNEMFSPSFLTAIERFSLKVSTAPPHPAHGVHRGQRVGSSLDFRDHQPYAPGDDLRRIDWNTYQRTRHLYVRRYERPTAISVCVLVDGSASMRMEEPPRFACAAQLAAAVGSAAVSGHNPLRVEVSSHRSIRSRTITTRRGLQHALGSLAAEPETQAPSPAATLRAVAPTLGSRTGDVLVFISDFFEPQGVNALIDSLRGIRQRLLLLQVTQPWDRDPTQAGHASAGDLELDDCETHARVRIATDRQALSRYETAYTNYFEQLQDYIRTRQCKLAVFDASSKVLPQLERLFPDGVLSL